VSSRIRPAIVDADEDGLAERLTPDASGGRQHAHVALPTLLAVADVADHGDYVLEELTDLIAAAEGDPEGDGRVEHDVRRERLDRPAASPASIAAHMRLVVLCCPLVVKIAAPIARLTPIRASRGERVRSRGP
jgi:hypothetical protein